MTSGNRRKLAVSLAGIQRDDIGAHEDPHLIREVWHMSPTRSNCEPVPQPLHFIWICGCPDTMNEDGKIQALNNAIREFIPSLRQAALENPSAQLLVRSIKVSNQATWHVSTATPIDKFEWIDLVAGGAAVMGKALTLVADQLKMPPMSERALPPVLVMISDGQPTDDFSRGLKDLMDQPWGKKAVRIAIAIGADADMDVLRRFTADQAISPICLNEIESIMKYLKWSATDSDDGAIVHV